MWQWSNSGQYYYYRDNDGRVHYSDGSVSDTNQVWFDNTGKAVYSANSTGPADKTGQYAVQAQESMTPMLGLLQRAHHEMPF